MYHKFSFCKNISGYEQELRFLNKILEPYGEINVLQATTIPFSFALSSNKIVNAYFEDKDYFHLWRCFIEAKDAFLNHLLYFRKIDPSFLNFCLNNKRKKDVWMKTLLFYIVNLYSNNLHSYDGPWIDDADINLLRSNILDLKTSSNKSIRIFNCEPNLNNVCIYEFPVENDFLEGSIVITNKKMDNLHLLFEDKIKIYGV